MTSEQTKKCFFKLSSGSVHSLPQGAQSMYSGRGNWENFLARKNIEDGWKYLV